MIGNVKRAIDWQQVEADYRAGILSLRHIAAQRGGTEGAIRKRAKRDCWIRGDLKSRVVKQSRSLICISEVGSQTGTQSSTQPDEAAKAVRDTQIVDDATRTQVAVVLQHRKQIRETLEIVTALFSELRGQKTNKDALDQFVDIAFPTRAGTADCAALKQALSLARRASTALVLANALGKLIAMERQAFGLSNLEKEVVGDPIARARSTESPYEGLNDNERVRLILGLIERAKRERDAQQMSKVSTNARMV